MDISSLLNSNYALDTGQISQQGGSILYLRHIDPHLSFISIYFYYGCLKFPPFQDGSWRTYLIQLVRLCSR